MRPFTPLAPSVVESATSPQAGIFDELLDRSDRTGGHPGDPAGHEAAGGSAEVQAAHEAELRQAYERGLAEGRSAVEASFGDAAAGFASALQELADSRRTMAERHEQELLAVAVRVAEKIVVHELSQAPDRWLRMIREGVSHTLERERIRVRLGRTLHHFLEGRQDELRSLLDDVRAIELLEDPSLEPTGCVIETEYGDLDLCIDSQLDALEAALVDRR